MVAWKYKLWRTAGAATALGLAACGQPATTTATTEPAASSTPSGEQGEAAIGESGGEAGEAGSSQAYAGLDGQPRTAMRLQHIKGFLLAAERVSDPAQAAALVKQGVAEAHDPFATEFGAFDIAPVRDITAPEGATTAQMTQQLRAGEAAIDAARGRLTFNHADIAVRMVDLSTGLYQNVSKGDVVDGVEYQHSYGAVLGARDMLTAGRSSLRARDARAYDDAVRELDRLIALWPSATAPEHPAAYQQVLAQSSRVRLALSPFL